MSANLNQRDRLMAALSTAEHIVSVTPVIPTDLKISDDCEGGYTLDLFFYRRPADVAAFADAFGTVATARPHDENTKTFTSAEGTVNGIPFRAWSLDTIESPAAAPVTDEQPASVAA